MKVLRKAIIFEVPREGYAIHQIADEAITVRDLINVLHYFDDDTLFMLSHDYGYTYGNLDMDSALLFVEDEDGEFTEEDM